MQWQDWRSMILFSKLTYLEHDLVNIIASMTFNILNYPKVFFEAGYKVAYIEREFDVSQGGKVKEVKFDIVLNNKYKNHSLACECKSGGTELEQLLKYSKLKSHELVLVGGVSSDDPSLHTHDTVIVYNESNNEKVEKETEEYKFVHLSVSKAPTIIRRTKNDFLDDDLMKFFSDAIAYPEMVHEVFRVNGQTHESKYVLLVAEGLIALSVDGDHEFDIQKLAPSIVSIIPEFYPSRIGKQMRKDVERKIESVLIQGSQSELGEFYEWDKKSKTGRLNKLKPNCKATTLLSFKEKVLEMSERIRKGEPVPQKYIKRNKDNPNQFSLIFTEIALTQPCQTY